MVVHVGSSVKVPVPGNTTFISYKTSLQDYCTKVGWMPPVYVATGDGTLGYSAKVTFGGNSYGGSDVTGSAIQDAEQRSAHTALVGLGVLGKDDVYNSEGEVLDQSCVADGAVRFNLTPLDTVFWTHRLSVLIL